jgi:hypothetical protein
LLIKLARPIQGHYLSFTIQATKDRLCLSFI